MTATDAVTAIFFERFSEFRRNAGIMQLSVAEQLSVLNVTPAEYHALSAGNFVPLRPELPRRLSYALSFMRRLPREKTAIAEGAERARILA